MKAYCRLSIHSFDSKESFQDARLYPFYEFTLRYLVDGGSRHTEEGKRFIRECTFIVTFSMTKYVCIHGCPKSGKPGNPGKVRE